MTDEDRNLGGRIVPLMSRRRKRRRRTLTRTRMKS